MNYNEAGNTGWYNENSSWNYTPPTYGDSETPGGYTPFTWDSYITNPDFLNQVGFTGDARVYDGFGDSGGNSQINPELLEAIKNQGFELRKMTGDNWGGSLSSIFKGDQEVNPSFRQFTPYADPNEDLAFALTTAAIAPGGFIGGMQSGIGAGLGFSGLGAQSLNAMFNSGVTAAGSGASDKDIGTSMLLSGGGAFLPNLGEMAGIENPYLAQAFDGSIKGAGMADIMGGDVTAGAVTGGLPGLASYVGGRFMDTSYVPRSSGQALINETNQASMMPRSNLSSFVDTPQMSQGLSYVPQTSPLAYTASNSSGGFEMPELGEFFGKLAPSSPEGWGNLAQGLAGMFMGGLQYRKNRQLEKQMGANRDAYQTNLRRQLQRRDAASGRRSNYSGRETQLAAALAELDSRNMPAMASLQGNQMQGLANMFQSGLRYAGKQGVFGDLTPRDNLPVSSFLPSLAPMPQSSNVYDTSWMSGNGLGDGYLSRRNRLGGM